MTIKRSWTDSVVSTASTSTSTPSKVRRQRCTIERLILEQTDQGAVGVLADVLALAQPTAFGRAMRTHLVVKNCSKMYARFSGRKPHPVALEREAA